MNKITSFTKSLPTILALLLGGYGLNGKQEQPNIILFFVDDMGWADSGVYGSTFFETPVIDEFAQNNIRFTQAYAQPLCSPSRAALLTGKYAGRHRLHRAITGASVPDPVVPEKGNSTRQYIWPDSRSHLPLEEITIPEILKEAGYDTWFIGKWHLGGRPYFPEHQGFDKWYGVGGAAPGGRYFSPFNVPEMPSFEGEDRYMPEVLTDEAIKMIKERDSAPFFLMFSHFNVHAPYQAKEEDIEYFLKQANLENPQHNPIMGGMLKAVDESLGRVLEAVRSEGIEKETIIIFMSDNGGIHWSKFKGVAKTEKEKFLTAPPTSNHPLRGGKSSYYEGGVRIPFIVSWPGMWSENEVVDTPVHLIDILPTFTDLLGKKGPKVPEGIDGKSFLKLLNGYTDESLENRSLFCHFPRHSTTADTSGGSFIRKGDYKFIKTWNGQGLEEDDLASFEMYNLSKDVSETNNLVEAEPEKAAKLRKELEAWLAQEELLIPILNPEYQPKK